MERSKNLCVSDLLLVALRGTSALRCDRLELVVGDSSQLDSCCGHCQL